MTKREPQRTCVVCRRETDKSQFIRVVRRAGEFFVDDEKMKSDGRGAYVCKDVGCAEKLARRKSLNRAFGASVPEEVYAEVILRAKGENGEAKQD